MDNLLAETIAVISDVHGNSDALAAVLADIDSQGIGAIINLGDNFSGPLAAGETADLVVNRNMICIRGNHDRLLVENSPEAMGPSERVAFDQLKPSHMSWLKQLPPSRVVAHEIFLCHGTPNSDTTYWLENILPNGEVVLSKYSDIEKYAENIKCSLILCGHTHIPRSIRLRDGRLIVNPGSVGAPGYDSGKPVYHVMQTGSPAASYAVVRHHGGQWDVTFRHVPYNSERMAMLATRNKRPEWARALTTGWVTLE